MIAAAMRKTYLAGFVAVVPACFNPEEISMAADEAGGTETMSVDSSTSNVTATSTTAGDSSREDDSTSASTLDSTTSTSTSNSTSDDSGSDDVVVTTGECDVDCGSFGTCVIDVCECEVGYTGEACDECDTGFELNEDDGTCVPNCGPCGSHAFCDGSTVPPACRCAPGYADDGGACTWDEAFEDPIFAAEESPWTALVTTLDPNGFGPGDGSATFGAQGLCGLSTISQTVTMPTLELAEPLALTLTGLQPSLPPDCFSDAPDITVRMNDSVTTVNLGNNGAEGTLCLGEAAYGGDITFEFAPDVNSNGCVQDRTACPPPVLRSASIQPASAPNACPPIGQVPNGTFEMPGGGWEFTANGVNGTFAEGGISNGVARFGFENRCSSASMNGQVSVPDDPQIALRYRANGTPGESLGFSFGGGSPQAIGSGQFDDYTFCMPSFLRGTTDTLDWRISRSGACAQVAPYYVEIDDIEFVQVPECDNPGFPDGSFEAAGRGEIFNPWTVLAGGGGAFTIVEDAAVAHEGGFYGEVTFANASNGSAVLRSRALVPRRADGMGPAVRFFYREQGPAAQNPPTVTPALNGELTATREWSEQEICLNPDYGGHAIQISLDFRQDAAGNQTIHQIDQLRVELTETCG